MNQATKDKKLSESIEFLSDFQLLFGNIIRINGAFLEVAEKMQIEESGFRIIINCGPDSNQEVPHLHAHVLGGKNLGSLLG